MDKVYVLMGATGHSREEREQYDYYATEPRVVDELLEVEDFTQNILEPCCGEGHISKTLIAKGKKVTSTDLIDRGYGEVKDFLSYTHFDGDIITNPPYKYAKDFAKKALSIVNDGRKVAMFLKLQFLEGVARQDLFKEYPPKHIYVCIRRASCAKNGDFEKYPSSAMCFAWFVWEKGFKGEPTIRWIE